MYHPKVAYENIVQNDKNKLSNMENKSTNVLFRDNFVSKSHSGEIMFSQSIDKNHSNQLFKSILLTTKNIIITYRCYKSSKIRNRIFKVFHD